jgi:hypothetical protein
MAQDNNALTDMLSSVSKGAKDIASNKKVQQSSAIGAGVLLFTKDEKKALIATALALLFLPDEEKGSSK